MLQLILRQTYFRRHILRRFAKTFISGSYSLNILLRLDLAFSIRHTRNDIQRITAYLYIILYHYMENVFFIVLVVMLASDLSLQIKKKRWSRFFGSGLSLYCTLVVVHRLTVILFLINGHKSTLTDLSHLHYDFNIYLANMNIFSKVTNDNQCENGTLTSNILTKQYGGSEPSS